MAKRYKYVRTNNNRQQDWTGTFEDKEQAEKWAKKWLEGHEKRGHQLKIVEFNSANG